MLNVSFLTIARAEYCNVILQDAAEGCRAARFPAAILQGGSRSRNRI
jgi:hypothetical protein